MRALSSPRNSLYLVGLLVALVAAGCGYTFSAADTLPATAHTIYVAPFTNMSNMTGIQDVFVRYMKDEIAKHEQASTG